MPLKIAYLLMRLLFGLVVLVFRGDRAKDAELLVLRHENARAPSPFPHSQVIRDVSFPSLPKGKEQVEPMRR